MFFSSSPRDGGVRFKSIVPGDSWEIIDLGEISEFRIRNWCQLQDGKKYDWTGVLGFLFPTHPDKNRWFCSEICLKALQIQMNIPIPCWKISPNELYYLIKVWNDNH